MNDFVWHLFSNSAVMTIISLFFLLCLHFFGKHFRPTLFYYVATAILIGFACPFRIEFAVPLPSLTTQIDLPVTTEQQNNLVTATSKQQCYKNTCG